MDEELQAVGMSFEEGKKDIEIPELGLKVNAIDIKPQNSSGEPPVFLAGGWLATHEKYEDAMRLISENGREVVSVEFPRRESHLEGMSPEEIKGMIINDVLDRVESESSSELGRVDLLSHSEGAIPAVEAALQRPDRFKRIVLLAPTGAQGNESIFSIVNKYQKMVRSVKSTISAAKKEGAYDSVVEDGELITTSKVKPGEIREIAQDDKRISKATGVELRKNLLLSLREGMKKGSYGILPKLFDLKQKGVRIAFVQPVDDAATPMEDTVKAIKEFEKDSGELPFDLFFTVRGSHSDLDGDRLRMVEEDDGSRRVVIDRIDSYVDEILGIFGALDSDQSVSSRKLELQRAYPSVDKDLFRLKNF